MENLDPKLLPRRIIISRNGSDPEWGGRPSPIFDREIVSLPIPEHCQGTRPLFAKRLTFCIGIAQLTRLKKK